MEAAKASAKVLDFWKDVCPRTCALCGCGRRGRGMRKRWRGRYCSNSCRDVVWKAFRETWLSDRTNFDRSKIYRAMWLRRCDGSRVLFDFVDHRILCDGQFRGGNLSRKYGTWKPVEVVDGYKCDCGTKGEWITHQTTGYRVWCTKCWRKFAWAPRRRIARFLPLCRLANPRPSPYEAAASRGLKMIEPSPGLTTLAAEVAPAEAPALKRRKSSQQIESGVPEVASSTTIAESALQGMSFSSHHHEANGVVIRSGGSFRVDIDGWANLKGEKRKRYLEMIKILLPAWRQEQLEREFDRVTAAGGTVFEVTW